MRPGPVNAIAQRGMRECTAAGCQRTPRCSAGSEALHRAALHRLSAKWRRHEAGRLEAASDKLQKTAAVCTCVLHVVDTEYVREGIRRALQNPRFVLAAVRACIRARWPHRHRKGCGATTHQATTDGFVIPCAARPLYLRACVRACLFVPAPGFDDIDSRSLGSRCHVCGTTAGATVHCAASRCQVGGLFHNTAMTRKHAHACWPSRDARCLPK